ncbi:hypothetical protein POF51_26285 [Brevibacillus sp. AG]|uniref:hypothetical protein n=1 Tax=Brevibacillus sp. AG TaxID=3020891 RepID=UPI00232F7B2E|nr:hypothetical protein [Brevibacillus sp. AG]MDC0764232.1 hypothetical protein [Brevibacillus sp. AG]
MSADIVLGIGGLTVVVFVSLIIVWKRRLVHTNPINHNDPYQSINVDGLDADTKGYLEIIKKRREQGSRFEPYKREDSWLQPNSCGTIPYYGKQRVFLQFGKSESTERLSSIDKKTSFVSQNEDLQSAVAFESYHSNHVSSNEMNIDRYEQTQDEDRTYLY